MRRNIAWLPVTAAALGLFAFGTSFYGVYVRDVFLVLHALVLALLAVGCAILSYREP